MNFRSQPEPDCQFYKDSWVSLLPISNAIGKVEFQSTLPLTCFIIINKPSYLFHANHENYLSIKISIGYYEELIPLLLFQKN